VVASRVLDRRGSGSTSGMATPHLAGILLAGGARAGGTVAGDPAAPADTIGVR